MDVPAEHFCNQAETSPRSAPAPEPEPAPRPKKFLPWVGKRSVRSAGRYEADGDDGADQGRARVAGSDIDELFKQEGNR